MEQQVALAIASWLFAEGASPIQMLKSLFNLHPTAEPWGPVHSFVHELVNCSLCTGFWVGVFVTLDWKQACFIAILSEAISRINKHTI